VQSHRRLPAALCLSFAALTALVVAAPWLAEESSIRGLDGQAWSLDYPQRWEAMPLPSRLAYTLGDLVCHQKEERSYLLHGNQIPVCARDLGLLAGMVAGFALTVAAEPRARLVDSAAGLLHVRTKKMLVVAVALLLAPLTVDGFLQLLTAYESTNVLRSATGLLFGLGVSLLAGFLLLTDPRLE